MKLIKGGTETEKQLESNDGLDTQKRGLMAGFPRQFGSPSET